MLNFVRSIVEHPAFDYVISALAFSCVAFGVVFCFIAAHMVFVNTLRRNSKEQWSRNVPSEQTEDYIKMYEIGKEWAKKHEFAKKDVHIINDGLNLYGEYYDFGFDKCVVILSGRTETLTYGYYFALPYHKNRCNVLVIDPRAHGLSDGRFNTVGFEESKDVIAWIDYIEKTFGVNYFILHGICIGAAGGMFAITDENCPKSVKAIVTEGMFVNFGESMKNHLKERKKPVFIIYDLINRELKKNTGHNMNIGPIDVIDKLNKPILMLQSKQDLYSKPDMAQKLYDKAGSEKKEIVWFEKGEHSMLRVTDTEKYDNAITNFLSELK